MSDGLTSCLARLEWAEHHVKTLDAEVQRFLQGHVYDLALKTDYKRRPVLKVTRVEPLPLNVGPLVGDALHNMRSALDHLVYGLAIIETGDPLPSQIAAACGFPILIPAPSSERGRATENPLPEVV